MKKKILALVCAMTMVFAMSLSVCAASSSDADSASEESTTDSSTNLAAAATGTSQSFSEATLTEFASTTTVAAGPAGASVSAVSADTAKAVIAEAVKTMGSNTFFAAIVDVNGGAGTYTLTCPNVWAGQSVTILHQKSDGSYEYITPSSVANNQVTFSLTSTSPVAILINTAASPKTGDVAAVMALLAVVCAGGAVLTFRKAR